MIKFFLVSFTILLLACESSDSSLNSGYTPAYDLDHPDEQFALPDILQEISGMAYTVTQEIAAIQDEKGIIFFLDPDTGEILRQRKFAEKGDYEGIAVENNTAYILRSDGVIFMVSEFSTNKGKVSLIKTSLSKNNNAEGLFFDKKKNRLLIAAKGNAGKKESGKKAIFSYDLNTNKMDQEPAYLISLGEIEDALSTGKFWEISYEISKTINITGSGEIFQPSGIAIQPITEEIFILSAVNSMLLILSKQGEILYVHPLNGDLLKQPEGLTFAPDGTLFISTEGKGGDARIVKYKYNG